MTPPQADVKAILKPGDWMALDTCEGRVFYVRELLPDGTTGNILLQHRPGVVGFKNRHHHELSCEEYQDVEPVVKVYPDPPPKLDRTPENRVVNDAIPSIKAFAIFFPIFHFMSTLWAPMMLKENAKNNSSFILECKIQPRTI